MSALVIVVAVIGGIFTAAMVALASIAILLSRRFLPRRSGLPTRPPPASVRRPTSAGDAIEVTATEIPSER